MGATATAGAGDVAAPTLLARHFRDGMRLFAGSVSLITSFHQGRRFGMTATAVCSVSLEPPTLLVCINSRAATHEAVQASGCFCVNILRSDDSLLSSAFSGVQAGESRFNLCRWERGDTGAPVLADAIASFDCRVVNSLRHGTHTVFFGEVHRTSIGRKGPALLYSEGRYAKVGPLAAAELPPEGLEYWNRE